MPGATLQMAQQHRLETGALPHDEDTIVFRHAPRLFSALWIAFGLVEIDEHEAFGWRGAGPPQMCEPAHGHFDTRQRIAGASSQLFHDEVDR